MGSLVECTACATRCFALSNEHVPVTGNGCERLGDGVDDLVVFFENRAFLKVVAAARGTPSDRQALGVPRP